MLQVNLPAPSCLLLLADLALHLLPLFFLIHYDGPKVSFWSAQWFCVFWPDHTSLKLFLAWIGTLCGLGWLHSILANQALYCYLLSVSSYILRVHYNPYIQLVFHYSSHQMMRKNSSLKSSYDMIIISADWSYQQWNLTEEVLHTSQSSPHHHCKGKCMVPHLDWSICQHL